MHQNTPYIYYKYIWNTLKFTINTQYRHSNKFKYTQILSNTLKYIEIYYKWIDIKIHYQYNEAHYKYTQMHWKNIQMLWCLLKYIYLPLKIHSYVLMYTFQIHYNTFQKPYILLTYITIPLLYYSILPCTLKLSWDLSILYLFVLSLILFFETVMAPQNSTKMSCTCYDMFTGIQKWSIFHESHTCYWLIKY
jgi:hypothetical protein